MQRLAYVVLIASLMGSSVSAQDRPKGTNNAGPTLGGRLSRFHEEKSRGIPPADYLIFERARKHARQRADRLEANRWLGISPNRPMIGPTAFAVDMNPGLYKPWVSAYSGYHTGW
jgi:hypothetical protein